MRRVKLLVLAVFALSAFGAVSAALANAETPAILCLTSGCATELEGTFTGTTSHLETLAGKTITGTGVTATLKNCEALSGSTTDTNLCKDQTITFTGTESNGAKCHSESSSGSDKDAAGTILLLLDLHLAAEQVGSELDPLLLAKVLGPLLESELFITCGLVKDKVKGTVGCLLSPGLTNIPAKTANSIGLACKLNSSTHDKETGTCEVECKFLEEGVLEGNLGNGFEDAWEEISLKGESNKDIFIDD